MHCAYIIRCSDNSLYSGYTKGIDPSRRVDEHNRGVGSKYTKTRLPVELVYYEQFKTRSDAMKREYQFKRLTKKKKEELVKDFKKIILNA